MDKSFLSYFLNELKSIFHFDNITLEDIEIGLESTIGWDKALRNTCTKFDLLDEYEWYRNLDLDTSDNYDSEIGDKLSKRLNIE